MSGGGAAGGEVREVVRDRLCRALWAMERTLAFTLSDGSRQMVMSRTGLRSDLGFSQFLLATGRKTDSRVEGGSWGTLRRRLQQWSRRAMPVLAVGG